MTVFGQFNMRKTGSPWHDVRLRQAVNYAINREDLIRYATKGNGEIFRRSYPYAGMGTILTWRRMPLIPTKRGACSRRQGMPPGCR